PVRRHADAAAGDLERTAAAAAEEPERLPENRIRPTDDLGRRRRHAAISGARGALRHAHDAGHHRRRSETLRPLRRSLPARAQRDNKRMRDKIGAERGWPPLTPADFAREIEHGSLYVGSPETVARKIAATVKALGAARFDLKYSAGPLPHEKMMRSIDLYGRKVMPLVRDMLA